MPARSSRPLVAWLEAILLTLAAGFIDYITGVEVRVFPLYFIGIAVAAWRVSRSAAVVCAVLSTASWEISNLLASDGHTASWIWGVNGVTQLVANLTAALLIAEVRARLTFEAQSSRTDSLTGIPNSRGFFEAAGLLLAVAKRSAEPFTLAYLDLDHFKQVNDSQGHQKGDEALQLAVTVLRSELRTADAVGRLGGDEFAVMMTATNAVEAQIALERVRGAIGTAMTARGFGVTASIGATVFLTPPATVDEAMQAADAVMYSVKHAGKNRVRIATRA